LPTLYLAVKDNQLELHIAIHDSFETSRINDRQTIEDNTKTSNPHVATAPRKTSVIITIDTEASIRGGIHSYAVGLRPVLDQRIACKVGGRSEGLGFILRTLREHGLRATFFVEAAHVNYFGSAPMAGYVEEILDAGQDVQLHVHPAWFSFSNGILKSERPITDSCAQISASALDEYFAQSLATLQAWTGRRPVAFRTGGFSVSPAVYHALERLAIPLSSNLCIAVFDPDEPSYRLPGGCRQIGSVREYPVTCFLDRRGWGSPRFRPLQVISCSSGEMTSSLDQAYTLAYDQVVIVTHPFEYVKLATRDQANFWSFERLIVNRTARMRLRRLCAYLSEHRHRFDVCTFAELAARPRPQDQVVAPLRGNPFQAWWRILANGLSDRVRWF
jgi:peptidoglycan/xylan/chitin deacetylase (PgdA/CDA1 family)